METLLVTLTDTVWTDISGGKTNVLIQAKNRPIRIYSGASIPAIGTGAFILVSNQDRYFPISSIASGSSVWARAEKGSAVITVLRG